MNQTCNKAVNRINTGAGFLINLFLAMFNRGGIIDTGYRLIKSADSRLQEAKKHLIIQIKNLIF